MKTFEYLSITFTPLRPFTSEENKAWLNVVGNSTGISNYTVNSAQTRISDKWNYEKFYEAAKTVGAGAYDVFLMNNKEVVPGANELFYLHSKYQTR